MTTRQAFNALCIVIAAFAADAAMAAADVERELNDLLDAGVDEICAFEMTAIVDDPELYAVFLKYCGKD